MESPGSAVVYEAQSNRIKLECVSFVGFDPETERIMSTSTYNEHERCIIESGFIYDVILL